MNKTFEARLAKLRAVFAVEKIPIAIAPGEDGKNRFTDNVLNNEDDGDPETLSRYILVVLDDSRFEDYYVWSFKTLKQLQATTADHDVDHFVIALDLDQNRVLVPMWSTQVEFSHRQRRRWRPEAAHGRRSTPKQETPAHVCGARGFGLSTGDRCPACAASQETSP